MHRASGFLQCRTRLYLDSRQRPLAESVSNRSFLRKSSDFLRTTGGATFAKARFRRLKTSRERVAEIRQFAEDSRNRQYQKLLVVILSGECESMLTQKLALAVA